MNKTKETKQDQVTVMRSEQREEVPGGEQVPYIAGSIFVQICLLTLMLLILPGITGVMLLMLGINEICHMFKRQPE